MRTEKKTVNNIIQCRSCYFVINCLYIHDEKLEMLSTASYQYKEINVLKIEGRYGTSNVLRMLRTLVFLILMFKNV